MSLENDVETIDRWYSNKCNGQWENYESIKLESTDNPGWLATVTSLTLNPLKLSELLGELLRENGAQVATDGSMVRVFAPRLPDCLDALAKLITRAV